MDCRRCNGVLRKLALIEAGIELERAAKNKAADYAVQDPQNISYKEMMAAILNDDSEYVIPEQAPRVVLKRDRGHLWTNVPQRIIVHSPSGFEWGYGGSGPADLALNILAMCVPLRQAYQLHQDFKWKFIATMNWEGGVIEGEDIIAFLKEHAPQNLDRHGKDEPK